MLLSDLEQIFKHYNYNRRDRGSEDWQQFQNRLVHGFEEELDEWYVAKARAVHGERKQEIKKEWDEFYELLKQGDPSAAFLASKMVGWENRRQRCLLLAPEHKQKQEAMRLRERSWRKPTRERKNNLWYIDGIPGIALKRLLNNVYNVYEGGGYSKLIQFKKGDPEVVQEVNELIRTTDPKT